MDIILPGSRTPPKVSGPTAAKPLAGRKEAGDEAGGGRLSPPASPRPELLPRRFDYFPDARRRGTRPRLNAPWTATFAKKVPQHRRDSRDQRCPQPALHRIESLPEDSGGTVKGGSAGARSARTLDGPEHFPTLTSAGQPATSTSCSWPMPIKWPGARRRPSILRECSSPSRLPSGACGGLDHACALPGVGHYRPQAQPCRTRGALPRRSWHPDHDDRPSGRGLCAKGAGVYRADRRPGAERHDGFSAPGGGTAGGGPRPPRACTT
jgi:hypothetical protein